MGATAQLAKLAPLVAVGPAAVSPLAMAVRPRTAAVDLWIGVAAAVVARVALALRLQQLVVREVQAKPRASPERASHTQVVEVAAAVQVVNQAAVHQLLVVLEVPGEVVLVEQRAVETQRQELQVRQTRAVVVGEVDTVTHRQCPAPAARVVRESSSCDTRFRPCRCQTLIRWVRRTTPVLQTPTTSLLSRLCVSRVLRRSVLQCNSKLRRHLLPAIRMPQRAPGQILVRHVLLIRRPARGRALPRHLLEEPPTSSALPRQRHWMARLTRRLRLQPYQ